MIELRWKKTAINPATAKAMGVEYKPDNWVCIEDEDYAVLQYREYEYSVMSDGSDDGSGWGDWQDVEIEE